MKINQTKLVQVDAKTLKIHCKVSDRFTCAIADSEGQELFSQDDGYVPDFMPGSHYGDYVILDVDLDTGVIKNWKAPTAEQVESFINARDE